MNTSSSTRPEPPGWSAQRFEALYGERSGPWAMQGSWRKQRKRAPVLASLPRACHAKACEPGYGGGCWREGRLRPHGACGALV